MNVKIGLLCCSIVIGLLCLSFSKSKTNESNMKTRVEKEVDGASIYQKNFTQFEYYIETIGVVTIDNVELNKGKLTAIYSYNQGRELRHVVSVLSKDDDCIYKGTCTTTVNGKVLFAVKTWLTFSKDGMAIGNWSWSGAPSKKDPIVKISKK